MSKKIKGSSKGALPLLMSALSKRDVKLPPNETIAQRDEFQEGGMVEAAQDIADKGRNGDSMLVHMAPEEVQGIAALGGVSINPETGLPEMFKFKDFLKIAVPIALTAMAPGAGTAIATKSTGTGLLAGAGKFLGTTAGKALLTGAAQYAGQRLVGTDEKDALNAGIMAGATYGAVGAANKLMQPSQQQIAKTDAIKQANIAKQQAYMDALAPDNFAKTTKMVVPQTDPSAGNYTKLIDPSQDLTITSIKEQFPTLSEGLRPGMTAAELDAQRGIAQADYDALQAPTDKFRIPGIETRTISDVGPTRPEPLYVPKSDVYGGLGAATVGALTAYPEEELEEKKRKQIEMAKPYSDPVTYPGAGYGSREYGYFGPNYGMYAKEGGHIKRMQEGGDVGEVSEVDEGIRAFQGDLMAFAPGIVGGANYGMGAMPGGMDSVEYNYGVAPNMGGYDYRSFVPADMQGQGITSVGTGMGTGEQITGDPNLIADTKKASGSRSTGSFKPYTKYTSFSELGERTNIPGQSDRVFRDVISGYTGSGEPIYTRETRYTVPGYSPYSDSSGKGRFRYGTMPIKFQEGGITSLPQTQGQVEGNGDGMSDEVYGDIENQQEVALSKDEFIVPADVVSSLGNGSSDAGADELYRMMERVRMAKSGKKTQPPEIDAEDYLPA